MEAYNHIGNAYMYGMGVEKDERKAKLYTELAAIGVIHWHATILANRPNVAES